MGVCCSKDGMYRESSMEEDVDEREDEADEEDDIRHGDGGARIRLQGPSRFTSMYTQQGRKGINQDSMTVWEGFSGDKEMLFCGVFDGHGPSGHKVARHVRDTLPLNLSAALKFSRINCRKYNDVDLVDEDDDHNDNHNNSGDTIDCLSNANSRNLSLPSWEASLLECFKETDEVLCRDSSIDSFCSGSTAVAVVKQGCHLIIANLGDSRAILSTRGDNNELLPIQLTADMKPDILSEAERIRNCRGRVFAMNEEPDVYRIWMPDEDCPGLAMSRAFGDFCLKDHGLISTPEISYRKLTDNDEFIVLATDGVWDVLTNIEVIRIVASAKRRSMAAKMLVKRAVQAWRRKYPCSSVDDCTVICLFLTNPPTTLTRPAPGATMACDASCSRLDRSMSFRCKRQGSKKVK
ncbi:hypothetical protein FH972_017107 [Carpinus fangiana]|uniref:PPM-type phosphatase domain-containing protein n=1 Tax=Carpinus fangiana TaxID=176857 RepID=A0A5N6RLF4_9ROSI|nr:hypothetical protein FH972_017107 [Carpinus fangiana]